MAAERFVAVAARYRRAIAGFDLRDAYAQRRAVSRPVAAAGDVRVELLAVDGVAWSGPRRLRLQATPSGVLSWFGHVGDRVEQRALPASAQSIRVVIRSTAYQPHTVEAIDVTNKDQLLRVELEPSLAYPSFIVAKFPRKLDPFILYPSLMQGEIKTAAGKGIADVVIRVKGARGEYRTDASGRWVLSVDVPARRVNGALQDGDDQIAFEYQLPGKPLVEVVRPMAPGIVNTCSITS